MKFFYVPKESLPDHTISMDFVAMRCFFVFVVQSSKKESVITLI